MTTEPRERVPETLSEVSRRRKDAIAGGRSGQFVKGPVPMWWLERAARLPGKTLAVGLLLWFKEGMATGEPIALTAAVLRRFGVSRKAAYRALDGLEQAGLITAIRTSGAAARVSVNRAQPPLAEEG